MLRGPTHKAPAGVITIDEGLTECSIPEEPG